jgi:chitinase
MILCPANRPILTDESFIQFYNTDQCSAASLFSSGTLNTNTDVTFGWLNWLKSNSMNPNIKIFLGLPGSVDAAHPQDYLDISKAQSLIEEYACTDEYSSMFGGVMLWDATYSDENTDADLNGQSYAYNIKQVFGQLSCNKPPPHSTTTTWFPTTTTTTTTTTTSVSVLIRLRTYMAK